MRVLESRIFCLVLWLASLPILTLSCGCQTSAKSLFVASGPGWHIQQGQALWRPQRGYPEIGGDIVLASHEDGRCLIQFAKTPMSLVLAQTTRTNWLIQFPPAADEFQRARATACSFCVASSARSDFRGKAGPTVAF